MKLIDLEEKHEPFDCASGMAEGLLATGQFKQYTDPIKPKPVQRLTWRAHRGQRIEDVLDAPFVTYKCATCGNSGTISGPSCHKTQVARCCGGTSKVPDDIAKQFVQFRKEWEPKHQKYVKAIQQNLEDREKTRKAAVDADNRRLAVQLRMEHTDLS
jgi:hypothetical protein